jgi:Family of unknown function (DUF6338)
MPKFSGIENFYLILFFIVPGIVALSVRSKFITGRSPSMSENMLGFFVISLVYYSLTIFFIERVFTVREPWVAQAIAWILLILIGPAAFGLVLGIAAQREWASRLLYRVFDVSVVNIIPAAWDWRFSKIPRPGMFIMATLTSGERVAGYFGSASFASSDVSERDLYIEEEYTVTDEGTWEVRAERVGILIPVKEIRYIEFWQPQTEGTHNAE